MNIHIAGKHMDTGDAFATHVKTSFMHLSEKFGISPVDISVTISKPDHTVRCDVQANLSRGAHARCHETAPDAHAAFDRCYHKLERIFKKHKGRIRAHHHAHDVEVRQQKASQYIFDMITEGAEEETDNPAIIAENDIHIPHLSVAEAVMRMELAHEDFFVFYNRSNDMLNVLHRRADGNIGWIDSQA
ncbi:MAG: ribosome-associated translation inhibitor RaiA [Alphaproteobacteria bacterium]|nr:MAG: ribosome-associated translation inhibitor RaiA [Alphaproteobacteria bacterium]